MDKLKVPIFCIVVTAVVWPAIPIFVQLNFLANGEKLQTVGLICFLIQLTLVFASGAIGVRRYFFGRKSRRASTQVFLFYFVPFGVQLSIFAGFAIKQLFS